MKKFIITSFAFASIFLSLASLAQKKVGQGGGQAARSVSKSAAAPSNRSAAPASNSNRNLNSGNNGSKRDNLGADKKSVNRSGNNNFSGNNVNIDNSKKNVNVNIDNSKDVKINNNRVVNNRVRPNAYRPDTRPPKRHGGFVYFSYRPYFYHPYTPFFWGPVWHPWGFFVAALATTAIIVSIENAQYHYDQGVWYQPYNGGYQVVSAPVGGTITTLPPNAQTVVVNETVNNYYYGGDFYEKTEKGYSVVPATAGTIVPNLPEGGKEVKVGDQTYVQFGEIFYQPIQVEGKNMYEIVEVKKEDIK
jgi:hypothetical protein